MASGTYSSPDDRRFSPQAYAGTDTPVRHKGTYTDIRLRTMSDDTSRAPSPDPSVGPFPNNLDIFWWEVKTQNYTASVSSATEWRWMRQHFSGAGGRFTVSLSGSDVAIDRAVYEFFHKTAIVDKGSWKRLNVTLRHLYMTSLSEAIIVPAIVRLGTLTYEWN
ncbi:hypothetical protein BC834DRAFT_861547 [Gloeopeniophorella convolvens]|nr:hypothetical protein BC834DRAFT_861547 [Gloeopeniophorella convolvens]